MCAFYSWVQPINAPGWISASWGTVDRGITASQEGVRNGHFFVGMALFRQVYQRAKSPQLIYNIDCYMSFYTA